MTPIEIKELRELQKDAAQGPFHLCRGASDESPCKCGFLWSNPSDAVMFIAEHCEKPDAMNEGFTIEQSHKNMLFVESALNAIPALLDAAERCNALEAENKGLSLALALFAHCLQAIDDFLEGTKLAHDAGCIAVREILDRYKAKLDALVESIPSPIEKETPK